MKKLKIVVVGNCQARPIADLLVNMCDEVEVTKLAIVHLLKSEQESEYLPYFEAADIIVTQQIQSNYPCDFVRTVSMRDKYGDKVITIINLFFSGYTPDWMYVRVPGKGPLKGPMSDYHNITILKCWGSGVSVNETAALLLDVEYNSGKYFDVVSKSLVELKQREQSVDVKIFDYINTNYLSKRLFFVFNHPALDLLEEYVRRILDYLSLEISETGTLKKEPLDQVIPVLNCGVGFLFPVEHEYKGLEVFEVFPDVVLGKRKSYQSCELVNQFFDVYSANEKFIRSIINKNL